MKNKILLCAMMLVVCTVSLNVSAQLKVAENGNVGVKIGNETPLSSLSIGGAGQNQTGLYVTFTGGQYATPYGIYSYVIGSPTNTWKYGIAGLCTANAGKVIGIKGEASPITSSSQTTSRMCGLYGIAGGATFGVNYGVSGLMKNDNLNGTGVYGANNDTLYSISGRYAGYFRGKTEVVGTLYYTNSQATSDARLKTNITDIKTDALLKIRDLRPVQFQWKQVEDVFVEDTITIRTPHFSNDVDFDRKHYGFLAQEVQKLFPELVEENSDGYLSLNYMELIPLLIQAVQDLSEEVEELKSQIK